MPASGSADPTTWHFLTGTVPTSGACAACSASTFFQDEGLMNHSVAHRRHRSAAASWSPTSKATSFTAAQLGDLVDVALRR